MEVFCGEEREEVCSRCEEREEDGCYRLQNREEDCYWREEMEDKSCYRREKRDKTCRRREESEEEGCYPWVGRGDRVVIVWWRWRGVVFCGKIGRKFVGNGRIGSMIFVRGSRGVLG